MDERNKDEEQGVKKKKYIVLGGVNGAGKSN